MLGKSDEAIKRQSDQGKKYLPFPSSLCRYVAWSLNGHSLVAALLLGAMRGVTT